MSVKRKYHATVDDLPIETVISDRDALNEVWSALEAGQEVGATWHFDPVITIQVSVNETVDLALIEEEG